MNERKLPWEKLFAYTLGEPEPVASVKKCKCGNASCKRAKHIRCVCGCHSQFHGIANRVGMEPLDKALGFEKPDLSRGLELGTERPELVPWLEAC